MNKPYRKAAIFFLILTIFNLISLLANTRNLNWGSVIFPGLIAVYLFGRSRGSE